MNCPICKESQLAISERKGIEIDYCPSCRGIWLDRGELDKILERSREEMLETVATRPSENAYRKEQHHQQPPKYKRRKSFLEELFD